MFGFTQTRQHAESRTNRIIQNDNVVNMQQKPHPKSGKKAFPADMTKARLTAGKV